MRNPFRRRHTITTAGAVEAMNSGKSVGPASSAPAGDPDLAYLEEIFRNSPWATRDSFSEPDEAERELWRTGKLVPAYISRLLDKAHLFGPDVDVACNAVEPEVDLWEVGRLYPRWDQTVALAKLLDVPVRALAHPDAKPEALESRPRERRTPGFAVIASFDPEAVKRTVNA